MKIDHLTVAINLNSNFQTAVECMNSIFNQKGTEMDIVLFSYSHNEQLIDYVSKIKNRTISIVNYDKKNNKAIPFQDIINTSKTKYVLFITSNLILFPGSVKKLLDIVSNNDEIALVHSRYYYIDENKNLIRELAHEIWTYFNDTIKSDNNYILYSLFKNDDLLINGLKLVNKDYINYTSSFTNEYEYFLDIFNHYKTELVEEFLYYNVYKSSNGSPTNKKLSCKYLLQRLDYNRKYFASHNRLKLTKENYNFYKAFASSIFTSTRFSNILKKANEKVESAHKYLIVKTLNPLLRLIYRLLSTYCGWWPINLINIKQTTRDNNTKRIGYFTWKFPILSETFIQREVYSLINKGIDVKVLSENLSDEPYIKDFSDELSSNTLYLEPLERKNRKILERYKRDFFFRGPLNYISLYIYIITQRYHLLKNFSLDRKIFSRAVFLAGIAKDNNIQHLHAPWADKSAFICLIASKLLGVTYSVQARAFDIYRETESHGFYEKLINTNFVVTDTSYNIKNIKSALGNTKSYRLYKIYEGLNIKDFKPVRRTKISFPVKILTVARLVEQKGIYYLLKSCKILRDKGIDFTCEIIGGTQDTAMNYYISLKRLHRELNLEKQVLFSGVKKFEDVLSAYKQADVFVLPCIIADDGSRDIAPNSILEAMAMKLPVISTNITGIPEIIDSDINGILVNPNDEYKLAESIINIIQNDELRTMVATNARKKIEERFDINKNSEEYCNLFQTLTSYNM